MRTLRVLAAIGLVALLTSAALLLAVLIPSVLRIPVAMLTTSDAPGNADLIVVLSPNTTERTLMARDLYKRGFARKILLIPQPPSRFDPELTKLLRERRSGYPLSQRLLMAAGVPLSAIDQLPIHAQNTRDETRLVGAYAAEHGVKSILLVTSRINSRRACWLFRRNLPSAHISCQPSAYDEIEYDHKLLLVLLNEFLKLGANAVEIN